MSGRIFNVLFLCTGNSARSVLAEAILGREGEGHFKSFSAGSQPLGSVNPYALELLKSLDFRTDDFRSKSWDEFERPSSPLMDFIFTVCGNAAKEVCPVWPGHPASAHWGVPDPAAVTGSDEEKRKAFMKTFQQMNARVCEFINLPLDKLDNLSLQSALETIGQQNQSADELS